MAGGLLAEVPASVPATARASRRGNVFTRVRTRAASVPMEWLAVRATEAANAEQSPDCASDTILGRRATCEQRCAPRSPICARAETSRAKDLADLPDLFAQRRHVLLVGRGRAMGPRGQSLFRSSGHAPQSRPTSEPPGRQREIVTPAYLIPSCRAASSPSRALPQEGIWGAMACPRSPSPFPWRRHAEEVPVPHQSTLRPRCSCDRAPSSVVPSGADCSPAFVSVVGEQAEVEAALGKVVSLAGYRGLLRSSGGRKKRSGGKDDLDSNHRRRLTVASTSNELAFLSGISGMHRAVEPARFLAGFVDPI
jgi:hypothetical protein